MKFITFLGSRPVHAADDTLAPLCGQTDGHKTRRVQQVITDEPTCRRCAAIIKLQDKNSPEARTRRRSLAMSQALHDALTGVEHFERRTPDLAARERAATRVDAAVVKLRRLYFRLMRAPRNAK